MNPSAFPNSRKLVPFDPTSVELRTDVDSYARQRDFTVRALTETQWARIINASCKTFFIKRGLDPEADHCARFFGDM